MTKAINFPYTFRKATGSLIETQDMAKIYIDRVLTLLSTNTGQRPISQEYGTDLSHSLFENENTVEKSVISAVKGSLNRWMPDVVVEQITVGLPNQTGIADVEILLRLPNNTTTAVSTTTAIFYADGTIKPQ